MAEGERKYDATAKDVAERYGVDPRTVKRWAKDGEVPFSDTPSGFRFNMEELHEHFKREAGAA